MITIPRTDCGVVLFHATKKENLPKILKEGIKPGAGKGLCEAVYSKKVREPVGGIEKAKKECETNIFLSGSLDRIEELGLKRGYELDTVLVVCLPQEKIFIDNKPFLDWESNRNPDNEIISGLFEVTVKDIIKPENIIGCLDIKEDSVIPNLGVYTINKQCK